MLDLLCDEPARTSPIGPHIARLSMNSSVIDGKFRLQLNRSVSRIEQAMDFSAGQSDGAERKRKICDQSNDLNAASGVDIVVFYSEQNNE